MTFKEFLCIQEKTSIQPVQGPLSDHGMMKRLHTPAKKGTTIGRSLAAGKFKSPSRPAGITSPNQPMMIQSSF